MRVLNRDVYRRTEYTIIIIIIYHSDPPRRSSRMCLHTHRRTDLPVHCVFVCLSTHGDALIVPAGREHVKLTELPTSSSCSCSSWYRHPPAPTHGSQGRGSGGVVGDTHRRRRLAIWPPTDRVSVHTRVSRSAGRQVLCVRARVR